MNLLNKNKNMMIDTYTTIVFGIVTMVLPSLSLQISKRFNISGLTIGILFSLVVLGQVIASLIINKFKHSIDHVKVSSWGLIIAGLGQIMSFFVSFLPALITLQLISGIGVSIALIFSLSGAASEEKPGISTAIRQVGITSGVLLSGVLVLVFQYKTFILAGVLLLLAGLLKTFSTTKFVEKEQKTSSYGPINNYLATAFWAFAQTGALSFLVLILKGFYNWTEKDATTGIIIASLITIFVRLLAGVLIDKKLQPKTIINVLIYSSLLFLGASFVLNSGLLLIFSVSLISGTNGAIFNLAIEEGDPVLVGATISLVYSLASLPAAPLTGIVIENKNVTIISLALVTFLGFVGLNLKVKK